MDPSIPLTLTVNGHPLGMSGETIKAGDVLSITFDRSGLWPDVYGEVWFYGIQPDPASVVVNGQHWETTHDTYGDYLWVPPGTAEFPSR